MGRWILQLPTTTTSAILIGDALWLRRATNPTLIQAAFHRARESLSLPRLEVACNQLDEERLAIPWQPVWKTHLTGATRPLFPPRTKGKEGSILLQGKQLPMRWDTPGGDAWLALLGAAGADRAAPTAASLPVTSPAGALEDAAPP